MRFSQHPRRLQVLIAAQCVAAVVAAVLTWQTPTHESWALIGWLVLAAVVGGVCKVDANIQSARITMAFTVSYLAFLLLGTPATMLVALSGTVASFLVPPDRRNRRLTPERIFTHQTLYNCACSLVSVALMGGAYSALGGRVGEDDVWRLAVPVIGSALTFYAMNTLGITLAISWARRVNPVEVFKNHALWAWPGFLASASLSAGVLWAYRTLHSQTGGLLFLPIAVVIYYSYFVRSEKTRAEVDHIRELNQLNDATISSLVMAIDAKDRHTHTHLNRVREYAISLAKALKVSPDELQAVRIASLLHDIGKIGIPEHILCKPGKLTPEEFEIIKTHVEIGAAILEKVQFPWPVVPIVWTHHERWDGLGYPRQVKGQDIPMGGRIISVVDVYDAITSERPYRKAAPRDKAIEMLRAGSGTQFDPRVVETFIAILPELDERVREMELHLESIQPTQPQHPAQTPAAAATGREWDESEEAMVLSRLVDLPPGGRLSDFGPLLAGKLQDLVPYTTFALFLPDGDRYLRPAHVAGLWPELFHDLEIRTGQGLSGHVFRQALPVVDAATLDLCRMVPPGEILELSSALSVPLERDGEVLGALTVYHSSYNFYQPYHVKRLVRVAQYVVEAMQAADPKQALLSRRLGTGR